jgi:REP element-mobilizing transposase RayT
MPAKTPPHGSHLRLGRVSIPNQIYVITTVTRDRDPVFRDFVASRHLIQVMMAHDRYGLTQTLCFVVMPDHLHWMMQLGASRNLGQAVKALKSLTSRRIGWSVFQKGFYDHAVRRDEDIKNMARYIISNPIRAGLVSKINDYPHWDAIWL